MKKIVLAVFILFVFGLLVNVVYAEESASTPNSTAGIVNNDKTVEPGSNWINISNRKLNSDLPFVLQQDYKACIDKCSRAHGSCMSKVGGSPSAVNNCDEQRWRCTLSCDNQYYRSNHFNSFNLY